MDRFHRAVDLAAKPVIHLFVDHSGWTVDGALAPFRMAVNHAE